MYRIKYYDKDIYIPGDDSFSVLDPILNREENKAGSLEFSMLPEHPYYGQLEKLKLGVAVLEDEKVIFKGRIRSSEGDFDNENELKAEGKLAVLNDSQCRPFEFTGTPEELFEYFLDNHNSQVSDEQKLKKGNVTVTDPNNYITRSWKETAKTWPLMNSRLLDTLGGFFVVRYEEDGDYLDWLKGFDKYSSQKVEFAENLLDISIFIDATETYTACIPYGAKIVVNHYEKVEIETATWEEDKYYLLANDIYSLIATEDEFNSAVAAGDHIYEITSSETTDERVTIESVNDGKDYIINEEMAAKYGVIYAPTELVTWDDVSRPENLLEKSSNWLNNKGVSLKETVEATALDLSKLGFDIEKIDIFHNVQVSSAPHSLEASYLVSKMQTLLDAPEETRIRLGSSKQTFTDRNIADKKKVEDTAERLGKIEADYVNNEKMSSTIAKELLETSSQILQTSEQIVMGILAGYTTVDALETYKKQIENTLTVSEQGFNYEFKRLEEILTELGKVVTTQNSYIRLKNGEILIGQTGENASPVMTVYTNNGMEIRFNNITVARYANGVMEVTNIFAGNQVAYWHQWATRKGAYIEGKGYNLNFMWIGG